MTASNLSVFRNAFRRGGGFSPLSLNPQLWLDATDNTYINKKNAANLLVANTAYLSSTDASLLFNTTDSFTFQGWFQKVDLGAKNDYIMNIWDGRGFKFAWASAGNFSFYIEGDGATGVINLTTNTNHIVTNWTHVAVTYDGSKSATGVKIYVNGTLQTNTVVTNTLTGTITPLQMWIGYDGGTYGNFNVDNASFFSSVLTLSQIQALYNSGSGVDYEDLSTAQKTNLVSWWDMNEISGTRYDLHSTKNLTENGTIGSIIGKVQGVVNNGDYIYTWLDKSGNSNNVLQSTGANQPTWNSSGYLIFDGTNDYLESAALAISQPITIFIVASSSGNSQTFFDGNDGTNSVKISKGATNFNLNAGTSLDGDANSTSKVLITCVVNGGSSSIQINNATAITGAAGAQVLDAIRLGADNALANYLSGNVYEVFVTGTLTASQITNEQTYLNTKYSIY